VVDLHLIFVSFPPVRHFGVSQIVSSPLDDGSISEVCTCGGYSLVMLEELDPVWLQEMWDSDVARRELLMLSI
jgi:hypothetical protein